MRAATSAGSIPRAEVEELVVLAVLAVLVVPVELLELRVADEAPQSRLLPMTDESSTARRAQARA
jgi:hypothetical protein